jgi:hypothetical protein
MIDLLRSSNVNIRRHGDGLENCIAGIHVVFSVFLLGTALSERLTNVGWDHLQTWSAWS